MAITLIPSSEQQTQHIVLEGVTWETYQALLKDLGDHRASRFAYDQGTLEIIMPSDLHEFISRLLEVIVRALTEELNMRIRGYGSTTLERKDLARGVDPDSCFYIQNVERILGKKLDIVSDPHTKQRGVLIYQLKGSEYIECEFSPTFSMVSGAILVQFLQMAEIEDDNGVIRALRQWLRQI